MAEQEKTEQGEQRDPSGNWPGYPDRRGKKSELGEQPRILEPEEGNPDRPREGGLDSDSAPPRP